MEFNTLGGMLSILLKQPEKPDDRDNPVRTVLSAAAPGQMQGLSGFKQLVGQFRAAFPDGKIEPPVGGWHDPG